MTMGKRLKMLRKITGLTQLKFSEKYSLPYGNYIRWEQDNVRCLDYVYELLKFRVMYDYPDGDYSKLEENQ